MREKLKFYDIGVSLNNVEVFLLVMFSPAGLVECSVLGRCYVRKQPSPSKVNGSTHIKVTFHCFLVPSPAAQTAKKIDPQDRR